MADLNRAIELAPTFADAYINRGLVRLLLGDEKKAQQDFDQVASLDSSLDESLARRIAAVRSHMQAGSERTFEASADHA